MPALERAKSLPAAPDVAAPDGLEVRLLLTMPGHGGMAHFQLAPNAIGTAISHRTVSEIWYFLAGDGEMWRAVNDESRIDRVGPGYAVLVPQGTHFQVRNLGSVPLEAVGVTMPPWPGEDEAYVVEGKWTPTVGIAIVDE